MRFRFDANQEYQVRAIEAVADVFQGQARVSGAVRFQLGAQSSLAAVPNRLDLDEAALLANLRSVQAGNRIARDAELKLIEESGKNRWHCSGRPRRSETWSRSQ